MPGIKKHTKPNQPSYLLKNLRRIKKNLKKYGNKSNKTIRIYTPLADKVQEQQVANNDFKELEAEIDSLIQKASALVVPLPQQLGKLAEQMAQSDASSLAFSASKLKSMLQAYYHQVDQYYLDNHIWFTPDVAYQSLLEHPQKFTKKTGGSKNAGKRTGVYSFQENEHTETMLIKQGANVGETIAEYVGANLYALTIPEYTARCIMVRDQSKEKFDTQDVYVASIYPKGDHIQDTFKAAGYPSRGLFAGEKARLKALFNSDESMIRRILDLNEQSGHTLEYSAANVLWHGDHDFHAANTVFVETKNGDKFIKIDHGFSFFNFKKKIVDIFNPFSGKVVSISPKKFVKGGKIIEFYPTNHFWDYAIENKQFYFNADFVKACEEIVNRTPEEIRANIEQSLIHIQNIYGPHAKSALVQFALRIGMKDRELDTADVSVNVDFLRYRIENHMVTRLIDRQASISKLADYCRSHAAKLDKNRYTYSKKLNKRIIENLNKIKRLEKQKAKNRITDSVMNNQESMLLKEVEMLKLIQQANDLAILSITHTGEFVIDSEFYFHNSGQRQLMSPQEFKERMTQIVNQSALKSSESHALNIRDHFPLNDKSLAILREIRANHKEASQKARKAY